MVFTILQVMLLTGVLLTCKNVNVFAGLLISFVASCSSPQCAERDKSCVVVKVNEHSD